MEQTIEGTPAMPELKPCPACGSMSVQLMLSYSPWFTPASHVLCIDCQMQGPIACSQREEDAIDIQDLECLAEPTGFEITAISAWNSFPRRPDYNDVDCAGCPERRRWYLTWTTEPPKVPGKYWWRPVGKKIGRIRDIFVRNGDAGFLDHNYRFIKDIGDGEWAGPIPAPLEPEAS